MRRDTITVSEFKALAQKQSGNKYHACKSGGYASRREHSRALFLQQQQREGKISGLREQVSYTLIPCQKDKDGRTVRSCRYVADFVYVDSNGDTVVEDTKGFRTKEYQIKRKLMLLVHGITITEI